MTYGKGVLLVVLAGLLWSFMGLAIRHIDTAGTWAILFWRSVGMVPVLMAFIAWRSGGHPVDRLRRVGFAGVLGGLGLVFAFAGAIYALQATTVANAVFLFAASPFMAALLGWIILKEPVRPATWAAIAVAGVGMFVMVRDGLAGGETAGNFAAVLSAFGFAVFTLTLRWGKLEDMMPAVVLGGLFSMAVAVIVLGVRGEVLAVQPEGEAVVIRPDTTAISPTGKPSAAASPTRASPTSFPSWRFGEASRPGWAGSSKFHSPTSPGSRPERCFARFPRIWSTVRAVSHTLTSSICP